MEIFSELSVIREKHFLFFKFLDPSHRELKFFSVESGSVLEKLAFKLILNSVNCFDSCVLPCTIISDTVIQFHDSGFDYFKGLAEKSLINHINVSTKINFSDIFELKNKIKFWISKKELFKKEQYVVSPYGDFQDSFSKIMEIFKDLGLIFEMYDNSLLTSYGKLLLLDE